MSADQESSFIKRYFLPLSAKKDISQGFCDDAAYIDIPDDQKLVISVDSYVENIHFFMPSQMSFSQIAQRTLRCALSDLAAKAADPLVYFMSLSVCKSDVEDCLAMFCEGLKKTQQEYNISLAGGDLTSTNTGMTITYTVLGTVPKKNMCLRQGAQDNDKIYITGTIGDSYLGLQSLQKTLKASSQDEDYWKKSFLLPTPQFAYRDIIRQFASASMDVSDGLLQDCMKLLKTSSVGAKMYLENIPLSVKTESFCNADRKNRDYVKTLFPLITGGDDYQILFTVPKNNVKLLKKYCIEHKNVIVKEIGEIKKGIAKLAVFYQGKEVDYRNYFLGFSHFH